MHASESYCFGAFRLVPVRRELQLRGSPVILGSRAFDLLTALVNRRGQIATKDELMAEVWPDTVVDENNLPAQVSVLRKVLASDSDLARCLQTVPGRGYRFVAAVKVETQLEAADSTSQRAAGPPLSIVVLPFANLSSDPDQAYFAQAMTETVATDLSRISGLLVISATTAAALNGDDVRQISRELSVGFVLKGNLQRNGQKVRINAQLIEGRNGVQVWSEIFDGDSADLLLLQDQITGAIANSIGREIFVALARAGEARNIDPGASDFLMRGIAEDTRPQSLETLRRQEHCFEQAIRLDPMNCDAHARLARTILLQSTQLHNSERSKEDALTRGAAAAEKAAALDPGNPHAHLALTYLHVLRGDFESATLASENAILLDRNLARGYNMLANSLLHLGRADEAVPASEKALRLDPRGPQLAEFLTILGFARLQLNQLDEAIACFSRARAANPKLARAHVGTAIAFATNGDVEAARRAADKLLLLVPDYRLSQTIDACLPTSPSAYRKFFEDILQPGAKLAGIPV